MGTDCLQGHERDSFARDELQSEELQPEAPQPEELQPEAPQPEELQPEEPQPKELQPEVPHSDAAPGHAPAFALHIIWVIVPMGQ